MLYKIILIPSQKNEFKIASSRTKYFQVLELFDDDEVLESVMDGLPKISMAVRINEDRLQELLDWTTFSHARLNGIPETEAPIRCFFPQSL